MELHALLRRQLKRLGIDSHGDACAGPAWRELLERVSRAYAEHEQESYLLERSQDLASQEMSALYATLRAERDALDTRVRERTDALHVSEGRLSSLLSLSADWIWEQDEHLRFTYVSDGIRAAVGLEPSSFIGQRREFGAAYDAQADALAAYQASVAARAAFREFSFSLVRPDGVRRWVRISGEPVFDDGGRFRGYRGVGRDVTDATLAEQKVQELARFDSLTGLPNRSMFLAELDRTIARARRQREEFAVCFIDLDRFKSVNDTLGHGAGDELLRVMAERLRATVRQADLVARLGGDEFVVLLEGGGSPFDLNNVAQKLLAALGQPLKLAGRSCLTTGSIGIARFPADSGEAATLLRQADAAMYLAKERGKNNVQFYTAELADEAARQFALESELRLAVARGELLLHFQPKVSVDTGTLCGMEALLRWMHPRRGLVPPGEFIPLAEERGRIVPIGRWVMQAACRQIRDWRAMGFVPPRMAINLSACQFSAESLVDDLQEDLQAFGVQASDLEFELTESALMVDPERASAVLQQLRELGARISIDDFGTGYSSLSYLKRFPAQAVKIDRSFIDGLPADSDDIAITQAVIAMAHSLELTVVAEGVETEAQLQMLQRLGCDEAQGYYLGRPMPAGQFEARLQRLGIRSASAA